jgi:uncharacterized protein YcfL
MLERMLSKHRAGRGLVGLFLSALLLVGCQTVTLISDYDAITDNAVTQFQVKVEKLLLDIENKPSEKYLVYQSRYVDLKADLSVILLRAQSIEKNEITVKQVQNLQKQVGLMEDLHKEGLTKEEIAPIRTAIGVSTLAILKLERAKQSGKKG